MCRIRCANDMIEDVMVCVSGTLHSDHLFVAGENRNEEAKNR